MKLQHLFQIFDVNIPGPLGVLAAVALNGASGRPTILLIKLVLAIAYLSVDDEYSNSVEVCKFALCISPTLKQRPAAACSDVQK